MSTEAEKSTQPAAEAGDLSFLDRAISATTQTQKTPRKSCSLF